MVKVLKASDVHVYDFFLGISSFCENPRILRQIWQLRGDLPLSDKVLTCLALFVWIFFMMLLGGTGMKGSTWIGPDKNGEVGGEPQVDGYRNRENDVFQNMFVYKPKLEDFDVCPVSCPWEEVLLVVEVKAFQWNVRPRWGRNFWKSVRCCVQLVFSMFVFSPIDGLSWILAL